MRQRRCRDRLVAEASDQRQIGRHHRDLPELRQRDRDRELERFGQFDGEVMSGGGRGDGTSLDFIKGCHETRLAPVHAKMVAARQRPIFDQASPARSGTRVILAPSALSRSSIRS